MGKTLAKIATSLALASLPFSSSGCLDPEVNFQLMTGMKYGYTVFSAKFVDSNRNGRVDGVQEFHDVKNFNYQPGEIIIFCCHAIARPNKSLRCIVSSPNGSVEQRDFTISAFDQYAYVGVPSGQNGSGQYEGAWFANGEFIGGNRVFVSN